MTPIFVDAPAVARMIGLPDGGAFLRARARLERDHDFPLPMPTTRRPLIWRAENVAAWVAAQGRARAAMADLAALVAAAPNVTLLEKARVA